jgi:NAD(P)-dependent dehydrogenase (short-subunit alcohol dehydrogenase family)
MFLSQATEAIAQLEAEGLGPGNGQVLWLKLDLSDPRNAKKAAEEFAAKEDRLDILGTDFSNGFLLFSTLFIIYDS